ncbi:MAPEG family protein, partial [Vibrio breoganii]
MQLTSKQVGVFKGMALAMFTAILVILAAIILDPFNYAQVSLLEGRATVLGLSLILPTMMLIVSIGR